ncbi:MAG: AAA-like domain-containing protein, partial [Acidobacteriota bacterium]
MSAAELSFEPGFYIAGGTLRRDAPCYVERQADSDLYDSLRRCEFCYVLTARQMGKSSLMVRTAARLREAGIGVAVLDLTAIGQNLDAERWYYGLLSHMGQQLELENEFRVFWLDHQMMGPLQRWMKAVREILLRRHPGQVVIFVDEIDAVRSLPFSTDEFFAAIREFYNRRTEDEELQRLNFCLLGVASPSDLIRDARTTPFNIGRRIELNDFTEREAASISQGLRQEARSSVTLLKRILYWTGGHPYLTQRLCLSIAETNPHSSLRIPQSVDRWCSELFLSPRAREQDDNLLFVRERMLRSEVDLASLLSLYGQALRGKRVRDDETNPLIGALRLAGIARVERGCLRERNRIYARVFDREWVRTNMPEAEVRRQRAAYRRGMLRATAVAAVILLAMAALALTAVRQRNRADRNFEQANRNAAALHNALGEAERQRAHAEEQQTEAERQGQAAINQRVIADEQRARAEQGELANRRLLYDAHIRLAQRAWDDGDFERARELLSTHLPKSGQEDLRGFEWHYLWQLARSKRGNLVLPHATRLIRVWFTPDGQRLATLSGSLQPDSFQRILRLWDAASGRELAVFKGRTGTEETGTVAAFSYDGKRFLTTSESGDSKLREVETEHAFAVLHGHRGEIKWAEFSSDGKRLATSNGDGPVSLWDTSTGRKLASLDAHSKIGGMITFSPDGRRLLTLSANHTATLWEVATGDEIARLHMPGALGKVIAFTRDSRKFASAAAGQNSDHTIRLWDARTGKELGVFKGHAGPVISLSFSSDGAKLASSGLDSAVKLWNVATQQELTAFAQQVGVLQSGAALSVTFSPDGRQLAAATDRVAKLWDVATGQELGVLRGHAAAIRSVAFSPDGKRLASAGEDWTARLWDLDEERDVITLPGDRVVAFSPDGSLIATAGRDGKARLWDAATKKRLAELTGHTAEITQLAFSPDGRLLATASSDRTARLWNAATGRQVALL